MYTFKETFLQSSNPDVWMVRVEDESGNSVIMTPEQWEYYQDTQTALSQLSTSQDPTEDQLSETAQDPANSRYDLGDEVGEKDETFVGSPTPYSDGEVSAPALYASLPDISNSFTAIKDWFGDTFFIERTDTTTRTGYHSERYSYNSVASIVELPFEETVTETRQVLDPAAVTSAILVVLVFVTVVTWLRRAIMGRLS